MQKLLRMLDFTSVITVRCLHSSLLAKLPMHDCTRAKQAKTCFCSIQRILTVKFLFLLSIYLCRFSLNPVIPSGDRVQVNHFSTFFTYCHLENKIKVTKILSAIIYIYPCKFYEIPLTGSRGIVGTRSGTPTRTPTSMGSALKPICPPSALMEGP